MKKIVALLLSAVLVVALAVPAAATEAQEPVYISTQSFIEELESNDLNYTYYGVTDGGHEEVYVSFSSDNYDTVGFDVFFTTDSNAVRVFAWNLVNVTASKNFALNVMNQLNSNYLYAKFYLDESDNTVTCEMEGFYLSNKDAGVIAYTIMMKLLDIVEDDTVAASLLSLK